uniref:Oogenesis-related gene n=1 Tax=Cyclopterus lumpus TaxID=8103 RepID=A0A8C2ZZB8_CYCLU
MTSEICLDAVELEQPEHTEVRPMADALNTARWSHSHQHKGTLMVVLVVFTCVVSSSCRTPPARHSLCGRKRLHKVTRVLLSVLPRWVQSTLGYPVSSSIGRSLSPEIRVSPTKPCGKGSKRKQDELDEDEEEDEESQTWVEALNQQYSEDEGPEEDPDFEPSTIETESEEYCSHNNTESDMEIDGKSIVIEDLDTVRAMEAQDIYIYIYIYI